MYPLIFPRFNSGLKRVFLNFGSWPISGSENLVDTILSWPAVWERDEVLFPAKQAN